MFLKNFFDKKFQLDPRSSAYLSICRSAVTRWAREVYCATTVMVAEYSLNQTTIRLGDMSTAPVSKVTGTRDPIFRRFHGTYAMTPKRESKRQWLMSNYI